jgi:hypothetical protein
MRAFQDYEIVWKGQTYVIPSDRLLLVIAAVEEVTTLPELLLMATVKRMTVARIARSYGTILRAAGVKGTDGDMPITDSEVYAGLFGDEGVLEQAALAVTSLIDLMVPPEAVPGQLAVRGEPAQPGNSKPAPSSSKGSTKRSLARAG